jgi:hypothetical protein
MNIIEYDFFLLRSLYILSILHITSLLFHTI